MDEPGEFFVRVVLRRALLGLVCLGLTACGGSDISIVAQAELGNGRGTVLLADDGRAYFSPAASEATSAGDPSGSTAGLVLAYEGGITILSLTPVAGGVVTLFSDGSAYLSPDGLNLGGGGASMLAYAGALAIRGLRSTASGVQTQLADGEVYLSADGLNLGGGGATVQLPAWSTTTSKAAFGPRDNARIAQFNGQTWISGGFFRSAPDTSYFDLWLAGEDGSSWSLAFGTPTPQSGSRADFYDPYSPLVVFRGELWAIGATTWASSDGRAWSQRSALGPRGAREDTNVFAVGEELIYIDPQSASVYFSADGIEWSPPIALAGFAPRCGAVIRALPAGGLVIAGGGDCAYGGFFSDVWTSADGRTWQQARDGAGQPVAVPWQGRMWPCVAVSPSGLIWMVGGFRLDGGIGINLADVWHSADGITWRETIVRTGSNEARHGATCMHDATTPTVHVIAGKGGASGLNDQARVQNDVKRLNLPVDEFLR